MALQPAKALEKAASETGKICPQTGKVLAFPSGKVVEPEVLSVEALRAQNPDIVAQAVGIWGNPSELQTSQLIRQTLMLRKNRALKETKRITPLSPTKLAWDGSVTPMQQQVQGMLQNQTPKEAAAIRDRQIVEQKKQLTASL